MRNFAGQASALLAMVGALGESWKLSLRSLTFRHALRLGITASAAVALYTLLDLPHGAWVPLTAVVALEYPTLRRLD